MMDIVKKIIIVSVIAIFASCRNGGDFQGSKAKKQNDAPAPSSGQAQPSPTTTNPPADSNMECDQRGMAKKIEKMGIVAFSCCHGNGISKIHISGCEGLELASSCSDGEYPRVEWVVDEWLVRFGDRENWMEGCPDGIFDKNGVNLLKYEKMNTLYKFDKGTITEFPEDIQKQFYRPKAK